MRSKSAVSTREKILLAACQLIARDGVSKLTLDMVAQEAGVSKGGLLYHFRSKDALITGMVYYMLDFYTMRVEERAAKEKGDSEGKWTRAFIYATCSIEQENREIGAGLIAAVANNPELLLPVRQYYQDWQQRLQKDGLDPALATLIRLAADGLWFADLFELSPPNGNLRSQIISLMLQMSKGKSPNNLDRQQ